MPAVMVPVSSVSGTAARISQLSRVVLPLLIPPCTSSPPRGRTLVVTSKPCHISVWSP